MAMAQSQGHGRVLARPESRCIIEELHQRDLLVVVELVNRALICNPSLRGAAGAMRDDLAVEEAPGYSCRPNHGLGWLGD